MRLFNDYENNTYIEASPSEIPHQLYVGGTGSGKTYTSQIAVAKLIKHCFDSELYIMDFKGEDNLSIYQKFSRYYRYKDCQLGLDVFHQRLVKRLDGSDTSRTKLILWADELSSFINSFNQKKDRDIQQIKLAECLSMGRSLGVSVICSIQRPDADFFKNGARDNFSLKVGLGNLSSESKRMIFPNTDSKFLPCGKGFGYASINGNTPIRIGIPFINKFDLVQSEIIKALTNKQN